MDNEKMFKMKKEIKEQFRPYDYYEYGQIERLKNQVEKLEDALSHCITFIAFHFRLSDEEINGENGIIDF
jgi:hypothetical protein